MVEPRFERGDFWSFFFRVGFSIVLLFAAGNTILRTSIESDVTLYRVFSPILCLFVFFINPIKLSISIFCFFIFLLYSFILASFYSNDFSQFIPSIVHYAYMFLFFVIFLGLKDVLKDKFISVVLSNFEALILIVFVSVFLEYFGLIGFPNLYSLEGDSLNTLRAFYWNQNDLAVVLCGFGWVIFLSKRYRKSIKFIYALLSIYIILYNGSKSAFLGFMLIILISILIFIRDNFKDGPLILLFSAFTTLFILSTGFYIFGNVPFETTQGVYSLNGILMEPISRILALNPSGEVWGSVNNRTDATIFVVIEYIRSGFIGLGPGGSWLVLTMPEYELGGAKSAHNALLQLVVDFGIPVLIGYVCLIFWAVKALLVKNGSEITDMRCVAILTFPVIGLSQSGAIITNYTFIAVIFFLILIKNKCSAKMNVYS